MRHFEIAPSDKKLAFCAAYSDWVEALRDLEMVTGARVYESRQMRKAYEIVELKWVQYTRARDSYLFVHSSHPRFTN